MEIVEETGNKSMVSPPPQKKQINGIIFYLYCWGQYVFGSMLRKTKED
jgi:hypothetical protein